MHVAGVCVGHTVTKVLCPKPFLFPLKGTGSPPMISEIKIITKIPLATTPKGLSFQGKKNLLIVWPNFGYSHLTEIPFTIFILTWKTKNGFPSDKKIPTQPRYFSHHFLPPMKSSNMLLTRKKLKSILLTRELA